MKQKFQAFQNRDFSQSCLKKVEDWREWLKSEKKFNESGVREFMSQNLIAASIKFLDAVEKNKVEPELVYKLSYVLSAVVEFPHLHFTPKGLPRSEIESLSEVLVDYGSFKSIPFGLNFNEIFKSELKSDEENKFLVAHHEAFLIERVRKTLLGFLKNAYSIDLANGVDQDMLLDTHIQWLKEAADRTHFIASNNETEVAVIALFKEFRNLSYNLDETKTVFTAVAGHAHPKYSEWSEKISQSLSRVDEISDVIELNGYNDILRGLSTDLLKATRGNLEKALKKSEASVIPKPKPF